VSVSEYIVPVVAVPPFKVTPDPATAIVIRPVLIFANERVKPTSEALGVGSVNALLLELFITHRKFA
jgi:hypothetical protein